MKIIHPTPTTTGYDEEPGCTCIIYARIAVEASASNENVRRKLANKADSVKATIETQMSIWKTAIEADNASRACAVTLDYKVIKTDDAAKEPSDSFVCNSKPTEIRWTQIELMMPGDMSSDYMKGKQKLSHAGPNHGQFNSQTITPKVTQHELGHVLGIPNNRPGSDNKSIMGTGNKPMPYDVDKIVWEHCRCADDFEKPPDPISF